MHIYINFVFIYIYISLSLSMYLHHTLHIQLPPNLFFPPGLGNIWNVHYFIVASNPTSNWSVGFWNLHSGFHAMSESTPQLVALLEVPTAPTQRLSCKNVWCNLGINTMYYIIYINNNKQIYQIILELYACIWLFKVRYVYWQKIWLNTLNVLFGLEMFMVLHCMTEQ